MGEEAACAGSDQGNTNQYHCQQTGAKLAPRRRSFSRIRGTTSANKRSSFMGTVHQNTHGPRVLIADDHAIFAESLRAYLEKTCDIIGVVADGRDMLREAVKLRPDVVVADVAMPLLNGLDAARSIRVQAPKVAFVFLTMLDDANLGAAALELGS